MTANELNCYFSQQLIDLAQVRLGGQTLACSDDFFAEMANLIKPGRGIFIEDKFTDRGKWMDGWESRRSYGRDNGREFDWCIIRLGVAGIIHGFDIDTNHFRGNAPQYISVEACCCEGDIKQAFWTTVVDHSLIEADSHNLFLVTPNLAIPDLLSPKLAVKEQTAKPTVSTHVRLNIFPDGGIARLRVYGEPVFEPDKVVTGELIDLGAIKKGARALLCSDMFFSDKNNLLMPGRAINMSEGWETKRRRERGHDWVIIKLATRGNLKKLILDTAHFKGNFPDSFSLDATNGSDQEVLSAQVQWHQVVLKTQLFADCEHLFVEQISSGDANFSHIRLNIFPDGGISRLRLFGLPAAGR
jgi:allantoicase